MRRDKSACPSSQLRTGSQQQRQIKVSLQHEFGNDSMSFKFIFLILVIQALVALVNDPEPEHPLRAELAEEFLKDRKKFMKNAEEFTRKHSEKRHD